MKSVPISKFRTHCLRLVREMLRTREPITLTNRGKPVAVIVPPDREAPKLRIGHFDGSVQIVGDIVSSHPEDWEPE